MGSLRNQLAPGLLQDFVWGPPCGSAQLDPAEKSNGEAGQDGVDLPLPIMHSPLPQGLGVD